MNQRERIAAHLGELDAVLLTGESNCYYATGFMGEGAALITRKGSWYFTDSRYTEAAEKAIGGAAVIGEISREKPFSALINDALAQTGAKNVGFEDESMTVAEHTAYTKKLSAALTPASALMTELRGSKDAEEIETMIAAQRIAEGALEQILKEIRPGMTEKAIAARLNYLMVSAGAEKTSFDTIIASGPNGSMPHAVPGMRQVREGDFKAAYEVITSTNALPALSGRVCPQESQCESKCVRGIKGESVAIGRLERFVADWYRENVNAMPEKAASNGIKVAVVGSGPAGLTCASDLAKKGYQVSVFEALHTAGGVLVYGIPEFRLPKAIVANEVRKLEAQGVEVMTNMVIGRVLTIDELFEMGYKAVFVGSGAGLPMFMNIPGESLKGVLSANEYLTRTNLMKAYTEEADTPVIKSKAVAVVGGGNVAMDAARCAMRLGAEHVYIVYRRGEAEMPARLEEQHHAKEEGIEFKTLCNPVEILGGEDGRVNGIKCVRMELGEPDASGRRRPIAIEGSEFVLDVDTVIMALGTSPNPLIRSTTPGLDTNRKGCLIVDENEMTTRTGVFAGGDAVTGAATVILAMGAGKKGAAAIDAYLKK